MQNILPKYPPAQTVWGNDRPTAPSNLITCKHKERELPVTLTPAAFCSLTGRVADRLGHKDRGFGTAKELTVAEELVLLNAGLVAERARRIGDETVALELLSLRPRTDDGIIPGPELHTYYLAPWKSAKYPMPDGVPTIELIPPDRLMDGGWDGWHYVWVVSVHPYILRPPIIEG